MVIPVGDAPNAPGPAPITYGLVAANVLVYALLSLPLSFQQADPRSPELREYVEVITEATRGQIPPAVLMREATAYDLFIFKYGYRPAEPQLANLFYCMFLHAGFLHLAGNMLFLWIYGDNVEKRLGPLSYLFWYLATGVAATLFHSMLAPGTEVPLLGASGAISGILGFYFLWFPRNSVRLLWLLPPFLMQVFEVQARLVLGFYLFLDNLLPFLLAPGGAGGVAHGAHIGGFLAGLAVAWVLDRGGLEKAPARRAWEETPSLSALRAALHAGRLQEAAAAYFALPANETRGALSPEDAVELAGWLREQGQTDSALVVLRRTIRDVPDAPGLADVYALAGLILLEDRRDPTAAYQYLLTALELDPDSRTAAEVRRALARIEQMQPRRLGQLHRPRSW